ncbi:hypothetical protein H6G04_34085 [Calothrix membranacea FACHB-236]|nr:hypothetical protein [Calothrix membranacea FACHB-236]
MSSNQEFIIKINDIIGKTWLATLDDSGGYVLSLKPIEQNSSSPVSIEKEQRKTTVTETSPQFIVVTEKTKNRPLWTINTKIRGELYSVLKSHFWEDTQNFRDFVIYINNNIHTANLGISFIEYEKLGTSNNKNKNNLSNSKKEEQNKNTSITGKIEALIEEFENNSQLSCLKKIFEFFKESTS